MGGEEAGALCAAPDGDGWGAGGAAWLGGAVTGAVTGTGVAGVWTCELFGGSGKSQGRGIMAAGITLWTRKRNTVGNVREKKSRVVRLTRWLHI